MSNEEYEKRLESLYLTAIEQGNVGLALELLERLKAISEEH